MRRRAALVLIAAAGAVAVAGSVVAPYVIAERGWQAAQGRLEQAIGSRLTADGTVQGRLWPSPRLLVAGLAATAPGDPGGAPLVYADRAKIDIGWRALLTGRLDDASIQLRSVRLLAMPLHPPADIRGSFDTAIGRFTATFENGVAQATLRPGAGGVRLETLEFQVGEVAASGSGRIAQEGGTRLVLALEALRWSGAELGRLDIAAIAERDGILVERAALRRSDGGEVGLFGLATAAGGELRFTGGIDARGGPATTGVEAAARLTAQLGRETQRLEIDDIDIRLGASRMTGRSRIDLQAMPQLSAELRADRLEAGDLDATLALAPLLAVPSADLRLRVAQLGWHGAVAEGVVLDVVRQGRDFELRELAARDIAGATLHAAGRFLLASDGAFVFNEFGFRYGQLAGQGRLTVDFGASPLRIEADVQTGPLILDALVPASLPLPPEPTTRRAAAAAAAERKAPAPARSSWSREPLSWPAWPPVAAALHLSAPTIGWRGLRLDVANFAGRLANGVLTVDDLSGLMYGGRIELRGSTPASPGAQPGFAGALRLSDLDLREVLRAYAGVDEISGRLDGAGSLSAVGHTPAELVASLAGNVRLDALQGVVAGVDLPRISARLKQIRRPTDIFQVVRAGLGAGRTPFRSLGGSFRVERGVARSDDLQLVALAGEGRTSGTIDLAGWSVDLLSQFRLTEHPDLPPVALKVSGPIENPRRVFDIQALQSSLTHRGRPATP